MYLSQFMIIFLLKQTSLGNIFAFKQLVFDTVFILKTKVKKFSIELKVKLFNMTSGFDKVDVNGFFL